MCGTNHTSFNEFILLGFYDFYQIKILLFPIFFVVYIIIVTENCLIVTLVSTCHHLNVPMYIFLRNLALADLLLSSNSMPKMLQVIWLRGATIGKTSCFIQYSIHCIGIGAQSLTLTAMALDRYLAICYPLRYSTLMSPKLCFHLVIWSWAIGITLIPCEIFWIEQLEFCTTDKIDHIFCDLGPILEISSTDTSKVALVDFIIAIIFAILPFVLIIISYICISVAIIKITSSNGRRKAFSACSSHLALVCAYYGPLLVIYMFPIGGNTPNEKKVNSLLYMAFTPLMNPVLYSMRNQEIKKASQILFCKSRVLMYP